MKAFQSLHSVRAFTILEMLVGGGVVLIVGGIVAVLLRSSLTLYVKNFSANDATSRGRTVTQRLGDRIQNAVQPPVLIDANGAAVAGTGPAAGIKCLVPSSLNFYRTSGDTAATASTIKTIVNPGDSSAPAARDYIMLRWYDTVTTASGSLFVEIQSVSVSGTLATLTLTKTVQSAMDPTPASTAVIKSGQPFQIMRNVAFIAIPSGSVATLRYYSKAKSVAVDGATAFNLSANFRELAHLTPSPGQTVCLPFRYTTADQAYLDVDIRSMSLRYQKQAGSSENYFSSLRSKIAFRSILKLN